MITSRRLARRLAVAYVLVVAFIVFLPTEAVASGSVSLIWKVLHALGMPGIITPAVVEFLTNVVLFMPLSFLGNTFKPEWGWWRWLLAGFAVSSAIELTQLLVVSARQATLLDVLANTLGALAGYAVVVVVARRSRRTPSPSADQRPR